MDKLLLNFKSLILCPLIKFFGFRMAATLTQDEISLDPLRGEIFYLTSYLALNGSQSRSRAPLQALSSHEYTISLSKILVGPPPESAQLKTPHKQSCLVLVSNLKPTVTDAAIKRECIETVGRPRFIYMHVADPRTGLFSGTAVMEFTDESHANSVCQTGLFSCPVRPVSDLEYAALTCGDWPMLDYGPPQGVFSNEPTPPSAPSSSRAVPAPMWAQPSHRPSNPWQK